MSPIVRRAWVMILNRWKMAISKGRIFRTEDGRIFAFPYGPLVAYLLPDAKCQSLLENVFLWWAVATIPIMVATIAVSKIYSLSVYFLLLPIVLHYVFFNPIVWFITRKWVRLPIAVSLRTCAAVHDLSTLYENSYRFTFAAILFSLPLFLGAIETVWCVISIYLFLPAILNWYMVILRHQDRASESSHGKSD